MSLSLPHENSFRPFESYLWIVEGPFYYLDRYALQAGLGPDSAIPLIFRVKQDPFDLARLTYPGIKCRRPENWLKVLALLYVNHVNFRLYQGEGREDSPFSLTLLRPSIQEDLRAILGLAARKKVSELQRLESLLEQAFSHLHRMGSYTRNGV